MATLTKRGVIGSTFGALLYVTLLAVGIYLGLQASGPKVVRLEWERVVSIEQDAAGAVAPSRELRREGRYPDPPMWPALALAAGEREKARHEAFRAVVADPGERSVVLPFERWRELKPGDRLPR
ncbi:MAG: hypothetical protein QM765_30995 [Myxococcales bacterium]